MAVRTKQLATGTITNANATLYTAAADETTILKYVTLFNPSATTATRVRVRLVTPGGTRLLFFPNMAAQEMLRHDVWVVMNPGDAIDGFSALAANNVEYTLSGTELEGVAD